MKYFVISDVHSYYYEMITALILNDFDLDNPDHHVIICGDLFDRGPDAMKCFEFATKMAEQNRLIYIRGNHEDLLIECVGDLYLKKPIESHRRSNGTIDTISQFTGIGSHDLLLGLYSSSDFFDKARPLIRFIKNNTRNYFEVDNYIFVHGWLPCSYGPLQVACDWRTEDADWGGARWLNGMNAWAHGARIEGKTIVCGHWHASWGHSHLHQDRKEFPQKNRTDWQKSFVPFEDEGIIAIDGCTAYSGIVNCIVINTD